jgi:hypothetical protein
MDILEFTKKFTTFKPSLYHETFLKMIEENIERGKSTIFMDNRRYNRWYKDLRLNEFTYTHITKMTKNQTFALASPEGIRIFKMVEFKAAKD